MTVAQYRFLEEEVLKIYAVQNPNPNSLIHAYTNTSSTRSICAILTELNAKCSTCANTTEFQSLIEDAHSAFNQGLFNNQHDNISKAASELKAELIYKEMTHVRFSIEFKILEIHYSVAGTIAEYHIMDSPSCGILPLVDVVKVSSFDVT